MHSFSDMQVHFRNTDATNSVRDAAEAHWDGIRHRHPDARKCDVTIAAPHHHQSHGRRYECRVSVSVPGSPIVVHQHGNDPSHEDVYVAVRDAFEALERQLERWEGKRARRAAARAR